MTNEEKDLNPWWHDVKIRFNKADIMPTRADIESTARDIASVAFDAEYDAARRRGASRRDATQAAHQARAGAYDACIACLTGATK